MGGFLFMQKSKPNRNIRSKTDNRQTRTFLQVQLFSATVYISLFLIGSVVALNADLPKKYDYIISIIIFAVASFLTGFFSGIKLRQNGLLSGIIYSLPMNFAVILTSLIMSKFSVGINIAITAVVLIISAGIGGILAVNKRLRR